MAFDASVGGAASNSYVTLAAAEDYLLGRLSTDSWDDAEQDDQQAALMMATARLDAEPFGGSPVTLTQRLQWPRYGAYDRNGNILSTTAIPQALQQATCELALAILDDPGLLGGSSGLSEFQHLGLGSLDITPAAPMTGDLPMNVLRLISFLRIGGYQNRVVRA